MSDKIDVAFGLLAVVVIGICLMWVGYATGQRATRQQAVDAGVARWVADSKGGVSFEFVGGPK